MSHSHEPSYYEIALTNRQVLVAFSVLLGCLVVAFLSGAWVARDWQAPAKPTVAELAAASEGTEPLEELNFFSDQRSGNQARQVSPVIEDERETSAAQDESGEDRRRATTLAEDLGSQPPRRPAPSPTERPVTDEPRRVPLPEIVDPEPATAAPPSSVAAGEVVIQVFTSSELVKAEAVVDDLRSSGYGAFLAPVEVEGRTLYRVRIGPFSDRAEAASVASQVEKSHRLSTWITASQ